MRTFRRRRNRGGPRLDRTLRRPRLASTGAGQQRTPARRKAWARSAACCRAATSREESAIRVDLSNETARLPIYKGTAVSRAPELLHGKTSAVVHDGLGVLAGLPSPFTGTRYHSLAVEEATLPPEIEVTGRTASGVVMALRHRTLPIEGVQFHPESVLTQGGHRMLANWLRGLGHDVDDELVEQLGSGVEVLRARAFTSVALAG